MTTGDPADDPPVECACPDDVELARASAGDLPDARLLEIERHLDACERCREQRAEIERESSFLASFGSDLASHERIDVEPAWSRENAADGTTAPGVPGYRVLEEIDRGGQGIVHRAIHESSGRVVAIKELRVASERARVRFEREARLAARLHHPSIVTIHDCGELSPGRLAIVMEWIDGIPLDAWAERVRGDERRSPCARRDAILAVVARVCDAVEHAHRNGVIHRDLKPANILVDHEDQPHVLDFGVASDLRGDLASRVTMTGEIACTLHYAAPEQLSGDPNGADTRADVYAIGATLHHALVGRAPHDGSGGVAELVQRITDASGHRPLLHESAAGELPVNRDLATIVARATRHDRERRYGSPAALAVDIRHFLAGEPLDARRDSLAYLARATLRRHRRTVAGTAIVALTLAAAVAMVVAGALEERAAERREQAERGRMQDEARRSAAVGTLLRTVLPRGNTSPGWSGTDEASRALDAISATLDTGSLANDPDGVVSTRVAIGELAFDRGALRRAEVEYRQALRIARDARGDDDVVTAGVAVRLARLLARRSSVGEARTLLDGAQPTLRARLGASHPDHLEALAVRAEIAIDGDDLDDARTHLERFTTLRPHDDPELAMRDAGLRLRLALRAGDPDGAAGAAREQLRATLLARPDGDWLLPIALDAVAMHDRDQADDPGKDDDEPVTTLARAARRAHDGLTSTGLATVDAATLDALVDVKVTLLGARHPDLIETFRLRGHRLADAGRFTEAAASNDRALDLLAPDGEIRTIAQLDLAHETLRWRATIASPAPIEPADIERVADAVRALLVGRSPLHSVTRLRELARYAAAAHLDERADALVEEALALARAQWPDGAHLAWALVECGAVSVVHGDPLRGLALVEEGERRLADVDHSWSWHRAVASVRRGQLLALAGESERALGALADANRLMRASDTPPEQKPVLLGWIEEIGEDVRAGRPIDRHR